MEVHALMVSANVEMDSTVPIVNLKVKFIYNLKPVNRSSIL